MKTREVIKTALRSVLRGRSRAVLTILAVMVGAFTLTITTAAGAGVTRYVNELTSTYGGKTVMFASKPVDTQDADPNKPTKYDPNTDDSPSVSGPGRYVKLTQTDLDTLADFKGVRKVEYFTQVTTKYVQVGSQQYEASIGRLPGQELQIAEGKKPDDKSKEFQVLLPADYVNSLGFDNPKDAVDKTVTIGLEDATETILVPGRPRTPRR